MYYNNYGFARRLEIQNVTILVYAGIQVPYLRSVTDSYVITGIPVTAISDTALLESAIASLVPLFFSFFFFCFLCMRFSMAFFLFSAGSAGWGGVGVAL